MEVIDPRTLRPLDLETLAASVRRTGRAVVVEEGWPESGVAANLAARLYEACFDWLDAPIARVTAADVPDALREEPGAGGAPVAGAGGRRGDAADVGRRRELTWRSS